MRWYKHILTYGIMIFLGLSVSGKLNALHIIGGDVVYRCKGIDAVRNEVRFEITFTMYRDSKSNGAQFDDPASFGIYRGGGNSWTFFRAVAGVRVQNIRDIDIQTNNPCILVPVNVGVQKGEYVFDIVLPISSETYLISFQRCCRNNTILNLVAPGTTGAAFTTEISPEAQRSCNNSPTFKDFPPVVICVNRPIDFDHSARDTDGDSLVYEFCTPLTAGGTDGSTTPGSPTSCTGVTPSPQNCLPPYEEVTFAAPSFTFDKPMGGNPLVTIDRASGLIAGSPNLLGQFVVGVCVREYRKGVLIGNLRRDFQFNVTVCETAVQADLKASIKNKDLYTINSCGEFTIDFQNLSTDIKYIQNYYWEFDIQGKKETFTTRNLRLTFPGLGQYTGTMILNKDLPGLASCSDTARITVNLYPSIQADFTFDYDTCVAGPVLFTDKSVSGAGLVQKWAWNFAEGRSPLQNPAFQYEKPGEKRAELIVEDQNQCRDTLVKTIDYFPLPALVVIEPNTFTGCAPASIFFNNLSKPIDETYTFDWQFGDGLGSDKLSPTHLYENVGTYNVSLNITSPLGCVTAKAWPGLIRIVPSPQAGFTISPEEPTLLNSTVVCTDASEGASSYVWLFDTIGVSIQQNPSFTFRDTGSFTITQIVLHASGCADTAFTTLSIIPVATVYMPNAFTPNNDGLNDTYGPVGIFEGVRAFTMTIWNRWGELVYETDDPLEGWDGRSGNTGILSPPGVYAFLVSYTDPKGVRKQVKGHCTLLR